MNAKAAKQIPLQQILQQLGHKPAKETDGELWYHSPFRNEKEPSFKINPEKNVWYDFGYGEGGNVLDFIMILDDITDISTALKQLEEIIGIPRRQPRLSIVPSLPNGAPKSDRIKQPQIEKIQDLENQALIQYLLKRGIDRKTAAPYVKEIYYSLKGKEYFALAFPNLSGGYELRNPYFQGTIGKKDISLLVNRKRNRPEEREEASTAVTLFEGFMDFLSALTFYHTAEAKTPVIVLNSVSLKDRTSLKIKEIGCTKIYLYLDRDKSGRFLADYFRHQFGHDITIQDKSELYTGYKDFNEFLVKRKPS
jgi:DNA primase